MLLSIVIHVSEKESARVAVHGVVNNLESTKDVHLIYPDYQNDDESMYKEWKHDRKLIEDAGKSIFFEGSLDAGTFDPACPVVTIPPYCELKLGAFKSIQKTAKHAGKADMHFALVPKCETGQRSALFGFTLITYMINWIMSIFYFGKLVQSTDILVSFVVRKGKHQYFPSPPNSGWIPQIHSGIMFRRMMDSGAVLRNPPLPWILRNHLNLRLGFWIFPFILFYAGIFFTFVAFKSLGLYSLINAGIIIMVTFFTTRHYVVHPNHVFYCLLSPVYFLFFPVVLIHQRNQ